MGNFYQAVSSNKAVSGLLLDIYLNSLVAFSLRKLRTAYTGDCIEVYNGTSYADIGFNTSNVLDSTALATHCGSNDGFVSKIYDQSGNNYDVNQTTPNNMAKIYDGASQSVIVENGKPQLQGSSQSANAGGGVFYESSGNSNDYTDVSIFIVSQKSTTSSSDHNLLMAWRSGGNPNSQNGRYQTQGGNSGTAGVGSNLHIDGVANSATQKNTFSSALGAGNRIISSNQTGASLGGNTFTLGNSSTKSMQHLQEIVIFDADMSSNRVDIENRINAFYNIY
jgi:hypothetical protein